MTREEAIEILAWIKENSVISDEYKKAMDMAIESLLKQSRAKIVSRYDIGFEDGLSHAINILEYRRFTYRISI